MNISRLRWVGTRLRPGWVVMLLIVMFSAAITVGNASQAHADDCRRTGFGIVCVPGPTQNETDCGIVMHAGPILNEYVASAGSRHPTSQYSPLGCPVDLPYVEDHGGMQEDFANGVILWTSGTGAHALWGEFFSKWRDNDTGGNWQAGFPTSDIHDSTTGTGQLANFQTAVIISHPTRGTHIVYGDVFVKYQAEGLESGWLGFPLTDVVTVADGKTKYVEFERSQIYWDAKRGAYTLQYSLHFDRDTLSVGDGGGGNMHLTVTPDGTYHFWGHFYGYDSVPAASFVLSSTASEIGLVFASDGFGENGDFDFWGRDEIIEDNYIDIQAPTTLITSATSESDGGSIGPGMSACANWRKSCFKVLTPLDGNPNFNY